MAHASIAGILCGLAGVFCALSVAYAFSRLGKVTGPWLLLISIVLPAMGLFAYFEKLFRQVATGDFAQYSFIRQASWCDDGCA